MKALLESLRPEDRDWELAQAIDPARLPEHIAIIMDGNGRWAQRRRLPRVAGHKAGIGPVRSTVETCARLGVKTLTLYAFSVENWKSFDQDIVAFVGCVKRQRRRTTHVQGQGA